MWYVKNLIIFQKINLFWYTLKIILPQKYLTNINIFFFLKFSWPREVISRFQYKYRPVPRPIETFYRVLPLRFLNLIPPTVVWYWTSPLQSTSLFEHTVRYSIYISAPYGIRTGALFVFRRMYRYASTMS